MNTDAPTAFAEIQELYAQTRRSINEYAAHPFGDLRLSVKAEPKYVRKWPTSGCQITVWKVPPEHSETRQQYERRCGEPIERGGFCAKHADDRDRLAVGK